MIGYPCVEVSVRSNFIRQRIFRGAKTFLMLHARSLRVSASEKHILHFSAFLIWTEYRSRLRIGHTFTLWESLLIISGRTSAKPRWNFVGIYSLKILYLA